LGKRDNPARSNPRIQKTGENQRRRIIHDTPERTNHIHFHIRLVPPGGGGNWEICWENGRMMKLTSVRSQDQRRMLQANSQSLTHSLLTSGFIGLRRKRNQIGATYVKSSG
jgi:hypothetical protein